MQKKSSLRKLVMSALFIVIVTTNAAAQSENKDVTITAIGTGKTQDESRQAALRNATEQAFGAFISSKTEMFNDKIVADQMSSVSSGNIKSYDVLNEAQLPDGRWGSTLKVTVSVDKLTSFVQAKGISIEVKGGLFALNIKQQLLNEQGEFNAVVEMVSVLHEMFQTSYDYIIKSGDPQSLDAESKNWKIPLQVIAIANKNMDFCATYLLKTLSALSLSEKEVASYQSINKEVFPVTINYSGRKVVFYLRKLQSSKAILSVANNQLFYLKNYQIQPEFNVEESRDYDYDGLIWFGPYVEKNGGNREQIVTNLRFPQLGDTSFRFTLSQTLTLSQIEKVSGYKVSSKAVTSHIKQGGYVIMEKGGHGLVASLFDYNDLTYDNALKTIGDLNNSSYGNWNLPKEDEMIEIHKTLFKSFNGGFSMSNRIDRKFWIIRERGGMLKTPTVLIRFFNDKASKLSEEEVMDRLHFPFRDYKADIRLVRRF
jgi:hypothetical protein